MNALTVLLLFLSAASAVPAHFPHEKTIVYKYYADVKAGIIEPAPFASQFVLDGLLHVRHDTSDSTLKNAYHVTLTDVKFGLHNGQATHYQRVDAVHPIVESAKIIQDPFLIIYDENGKFQGIKLVENESGWSTNIKQAIASMLQLDLANIHVETPVKPHTFITKENTIHGTCNVSYNVQPLEHVHPESSNTFVVTKLHEPKTCTHFVQRVFDHVQQETCHVQPEDGMSTASRRVFEIEDQGTAILIKKVIGHGVINYFPWQARSESHYLLTNQTLTLEKIVPWTEVPVSHVNFQNIPIVRDVTFVKPQGNYALHAAEDLTHGRHIVKLDVLIPKLKKMLGEAADYLEENHIEVKQPDWKHGQTINRLLQTMSYMDLGSLEQVYNTIQDTKTVRDGTIRNIFLEMLPNVGTTASCLFIRNVIRKHKVSDLSATMMLHKLPMHVKVPTERLLMEMEDLLKFGESVSLGVRKASILCFASLVHKTFKNQQVDVTNPLLDRYLQHFLEHVKNEPVFEMRTVYVMAINNVQVGNIHKLLEPIIRGDLVISEKPDVLRLQALLAIRKAVVKDVNVLHDLLWPILANVKLPFQERIVAYQILMERFPDMKHMMNMYWFMVYEKDEHLYNYHLSTIKGLANSVDPCLMPVRETARKILRFTRIRPVTGVLSTRYHFDYVDPKYGHGETLQASLLYDKLFGFPHIGCVEHTTTVARKPVKQMTIYWSVTGVKESLRKLVESFMVTVKPITNENVKNVLLRAAQDMPALKDLQVHVVVMMNDHAIIANYYEAKDWNKLINDGEQWKQYFKSNYDAETFNWQQVTYDNLYEMNVPTDIGFPAVLATRMPSVMSIRSDSDLIDTKPLNLKLKVDARIWQHGEYVMSIYNPIVDVWHSIRRTMSRDVVLPAEMNIVFNQQTNSLKVALPRLPVSKLSVAGVSTRAKNYVTITEDETDMLKKSCATCHHHEVVTTGVVQKKLYQNTIDSKNTGLQLHVAIFDCEDNVTPTERLKEIQRVLSAEHKNTMNNWIVHFVMASRQLMMNDIISPTVGGCGNLIKIEPSILYPTSHVDLNVRMNVENLDHLHDKLHAFSSEKINIRGTLDIKAASTNASIQSWDVNVNVDMSQGHINNNLKIQITRVVPGEKNLKICMDAQKNYPIIEIDPVKLGVSKEEVNTKMTIWIGQTDEDKCVRDETVITMTVKAEQTEEQKTHLTHDKIHSACVKDIQNPLLQTQKGHIPKTWACVREIVLHSILRKYTINMAYKKVPQDIITNVVILEDLARAVFLPHVRYLSTHTESGTAKVTLEFPDSTNHLQLSVVNPVCGYELVELPFGHPIWNILMDNTRFPITSLNAYVNDDISYCMIYPQVLVTLDNGTLPFVLSDQWTLLIGDYVDKTFSLFVKSVQSSKIAMKLFVEDHTLEILPGEPKPTVIVNGNVVDHHEKGVMIPGDAPTNYAFKLSEISEHLVMQSLLIPVGTLYTPNSVTVVAHNALKGGITGLCGHMNGMHKETIPKIYSVAHL